MITALMFVVFLALFAGVVADSGRRARLLAKPASDWVVDVLGLWVQGLGIPALEVVLVGALLHRIAPAWAGSVELPFSNALVGFALNVVVVDYAYYWNHRLLHRRHLFPIHAVHHTITSMDVLGTSRNTLWSSLFVGYVWINGAALYLLAHPAGFLAGATLTAMLDLWRHSGLGPARGSRLHALLSGWLVLPEDHAWHHARGEVFGNYGANWLLWDRLHGTRIAATEAPSALGIDLPLSLGRKLLWPFGGAAGA